MYQTNCMKADNIQLCRLQRGKETEREERHRHLRRREAIGNGVLTNLTNLSSPVALTGTAGDVHLVLTGLKTKIYHSRIRSVWSKKLVTVRFAHTYTYCINAHYYSTTGIQANVNCFCLDDLDLVGRRRVRGTYLSKEVSEGYDSLSDSSFSSSIFWNTPYWG